MDGGGRRGGGRGRGRGDGNWTIISVSNMISVSLDSWGMDGWEEERNYFSISPVNFGREDEEKELLTRLRVRASSILALLGRN